MGPCSRLEFPNEMSCSIYVSRSLYQFNFRSTVGHRDVPWFKTKWNNLLPIGNSPFAPSEISGFFFPKWKAPQMYTFPDQMNWQFLQILMDSKFQSKLRVLDTDDVKQKTSLLISIFCQWNMFNFGEYAEICHLPLASLKELHLISLTYWNSLTWLTGND